MEETGHVSQWFTFNIFSQNWCWKFSNLKQIFTPESDITSKIRYQVIQYERPVPHLCVRSLWLCRFLWTEFYWRPMPQTACLNLTESSNWTLILQTSQKVCNSTILETSGNSCMPRISFWIAFSSLTYYQMAGFFVYMSSLSIGILRTHRDKKIRENCQP